MQLAAGPWLTHGHTFTHCQYPAVSSSIPQYPAVSQYPHQRWPVSSSIPQYPAVSCSILVPGVGPRAIIALRPQSYVRQRDARQQLGGEGLSQLSSVGKRRLP